jgi:hypothetical protein
MKLLPLQGQEMKMKKIKLKLLETRTFWWLLPLRRLIQPIQSIIPIILSLKLLQPLRLDEAAAGLPAEESSLLGPQNEPSRLLVLSLTQWCVNPYP